MESEQEESCQLKKCVKCKQKWEAARKALAENARGCISARKCNDEKGKERERKRPAVFEELTVSADLISALGLLQLLTIFTFLNARRPGVFFLLLAVAQVLLVAVVELRSLKIIVRRRAFNPCRLSTARLLLLGKVEGEELEDRVSAN